ncbi:MAG: PstS family phosphate ABC transporter substrate-binding protein [Opitutales bacterium]
MRCAACAVLLGSLALHGAGSEESAAEASRRALAGMPPYQPVEQVSGTIRIWGHGSAKRDFMGGLLKRWTDGFTRYHPGIRIENRMYGTASAIGALYTGAGDIALLGEEIAPAAAAAFEREKGYAPTGVPIATGSLDVNFFDYAHMVFVHRDNPVTRMSLAQLDAIFGTERRRGAPALLRTWGQLGLTGGWADRPIQPYSWKVDEDFALFIREVLLENSHRWNPAVKEYVHVTRPDGTQYDHGKQILDALARDPGGIAISNIRYANPQVRALALAREEGGPWFEPTPANLISQDYPLVRIIPAFVDRAPGKSLDPRVREFLRYLLSREGQEALVQESDYLPLSPHIVRQQLEKLP